MSGTWRRPRISSPGRSSGLLKVTTASCVRPRPYRVIRYSLGPGTTGCVLSYAIGHTEGRT